MKHDNFLAKIFLKSSLVILEIFSPKKLAKYIGFLLKLLPSFAKMDRNIFFAENWQKSPKIVIITSTPGLTNSFPRIFRCRRCRRSAVRARPRSPLRDVAGVLRQVLSLAVTVEDLQVQDRLVVVFL
jgi:hypothetical protein